MQDKKLVTDILLICKQRYDNKKYKNKLEALNAYYHKYYGCEEISMDYRFAVILFIHPCVEYFLTEDNCNSFLRFLLLEETICEKVWLNHDGCSEFYEVLYHRLSTWLCMLSISKKNDVTGDWELAPELYKYPVSDENWSVI